MAKKEKPQGLNISIGKELAYMIVLPKALDALSQKKRRHNRNQERTNTSTTYENLLCLKNSLDILFIQTNKKNTEEYKLQLYKKILTEKLILNIAAGKNSEIRQNIAQIMKDEGLNFVEREESLISPEQKFLIKTEFHGMSHYPSKEMLSPYFRAHIEQDKAKTEEKEYIGEQYNVDMIPSWKYFRQFSSFKKRAGYFAQAMAEAKIPPSDIGQLNAYDLIALLKGYNQRHDIPSFETAKSKFIKFFIGHHEKEFRSYMFENEQTIRQALHNKGISLDDKKNPRAYKEWVEKNILQMKTKGSVPPLFNIHHKNPVKDSKTEENLSTANNPNNLCLILEAPYHNMLHLFDTNVLGKTIFNRKVKRVLLPQGMIFFGGFDKKFQIYHQQEAEYAKILTVLINGKQNKK